MTRPHTSLGWTTKTLSLMVSPPPHAAEGCAELSCPRQGLLVTGEGHIMVDTKDTAAVMTAGQVCASM